MKFNNKYLRSVAAPTRVTKGHVYLVLTPTGLWRVSQTGQRSWDAINIDYVEGEETVIHGNAGNILGAVRDRLNVMAIYGFGNKVEYRKAVMEYMFSGKLGEFEITVEVRND